MANTELKDIEEQARQWSVILSSGDADKDTLNQFKQWREADKRHAQIFVQEDRVWQGMCDFEHLRRYAALPAKERSGLATVFPSVLEAGQNFFNGVFQPQRLALGGAFALLLTLGLVFMLPKNAPAPMVASTTYESVHAEVKSVTLEDGSVMAMKPESLIVVSYADERRSIRIENGGALFEVEENPSRPFVVTTGATETRVLGTIFSVEMKAGEVFVAVKEGKVRVGKPSEKSSDQQHEILTLGQAVVASLDGDVGSVQNVDPDAVGTWKHGKLVFENASLKEIIDEANRFYQGDILLADTKTADLRLSITFKTDNIEFLIENLAEVLPLEINRDVPGRVILRLNE